MTKLCHIKCNHPANFYISLELLLLNLFIEQVCKWWHYCHHVISDMFADIIKVFVVC